MAGFEPCINLLMVKGRYSPKHYHCATSQSTGRTIFCKARSLIGYFESLLLHQPKYPGLFLSNGFHWDKRFNVMKNPSHVFPGIRVLPHLLFFFHRWGYPSRSTTITNSYTKLSATCYYHDTRHWTLRKVQQEVEESDLCSRFWRPLFYH